jgi:hypothetical protein
MSSFILRAALIGGAVGGILSFVVTSAAYLYFDAPPGGYAAGWVILLWFAVAYYSF